MQCSVYAATVVETMSAISTPLCIHASARAVLIIFDGEEDRSEFGRREAHGRATMSRKRDELLMIIGK